MNINSLKYSSKIIIEWRVAAAGSYPTSKVRTCAREEISHVQDKEQQLCFAGAVLKRCPTPKVREIPVR